MIEHYFQLGKGGLGEPLAGRVRDAILGSDADGVPALNLTPAQVEQLAIHLPVYLPCTSPYLPR